MASILIVDDIPAIHEMLKGLLSPSGHDCDGSTTGARALELYQEKKYDVVIVDYSMTPMDGLEFIRRLYELDPKAVVIMMTGYSSEDAMEDVKDANAFAFVSKPFQLKELYKVIEEGIQFRQESVGS